MDPTANFVISIITTKACALLGLWLCVASRARRERERYRYILKVTKAAPSEGRLELEDQNRDGHQVRVQVDSTVFGEGQVS